MDAVLLVSFGGPESMDEVMPFLRRVTAGRNVPEERLLAVAQHYFERDGVSPINAQNRELTRLLR
jgi:ferrochelatase